MTDQLVSYWTCVEKLYFLHNLNNAACIICMLFRAPSLSPRNPRRDSRGGASGGGGGGGHMLLGVPRRRSRGASLPGNVELCQGQQSPILIFHKILFNFVQNHDTHFPVKLTHIETAQPIDTSSKTLTIIG
jgi:hypothetical protein